MNTESDVVIIGAGPSGAVAALELLRAGMSVTVLEQGDWVPADHFDGGAPRMGADATPTLAPPTRTSAVGPRIIRSTRPHPM